jgi:uncharacterized repeat protein (TIGR01451 family)
MAVGCAGAALVAAGCGLTNSASKTTTVTQTVTRTVTHTVTSASPAAGGPCTAHDLTATFQVLEGSAGAGNIVYTLKVTNASQAACTVRGFPTIDFLDSNSAVMPSSVTAKADHVPIVTLQPGDSARSQIRFSPDVDPCDPGTATTLRLTMSDSSTLETKIDPATRLCGNGSLQPSLFTGAD